MKERTGISIQEWLKVNYSTETKYPSAYLSEEDLTLIRLEVARSLNQGDQEPTEDLLSIVNNPELGLEDSHKRQLLLQITLGQIDHLLDTSNDPGKQTEEIVFSLEANPAEYHPIDYPEAIIDTLGSRLPELSLKILDYHQNPSFPNQYLSLVAKTMKLLPQHQVEIAQQAVSFLKNITPNEKDSHAIDSSISRFIQLLLLRTDSKNKHWSQLLPIAADLLSTITDPSNLHLATHEILRLTITHPKKSRDSYQQIKQQAMDNLAPNKLAPNFLTSAYFPEIFTDIIWISEPAQSYAWIQELIQAQPDATKTHSKLKALGDLTTKDIQRIKQKLNLKESERFLRGIIHFATIEQPYNFSFLNQDLAKLLIKVDLSQLIINLAVPHSDTLYRVYRDKGVDQARKLAQEMKLNLATTLRPHILVRNQYMENPHPFVKRSNTINNSLS